VWQSASNLVKFLELADTDATKERGRRFFVSHVALVHIIAVSSMLFVTGIRSINRAILYADE
jgi:hypothetical protein